MRINGIGTALLNATAVAADGSYSAYKVFTFLYAPIFPIAKVRMKRKVTKSNVFELEFEVKEKMDTKAIVWIFIKGWILYPILLFAPLAIVVIEVYTALGLPEKLYHYFFGFALVYLGVLSWVLSERYECQGLPKDYKKVLKATL